MQIHSILFSVTLKVKFILDKVCMFALLIRLIRLSKNLINLKTI